MLRKCRKSLCGVGVCKPNLVKCFGPRLRLWTCTLCQGQAFQYTHKHKYKHQHEFKHKQKQKDKQKHKHKHKHEPFTKAFRLVEQCFERTISKLMMVLMFFKLPTMTVYILSQPSSTQHNSSWSDNVTTPPHRNF